MKVFRVLILNTGSNLSVMIVKLAITFVMTPIFVENLGRYDLGIWEMLGAVVGYMGLLDVGLRPALSRFAARYRAQGDRLALEQTYASGLAFMSALGGVLCALLVAWGIFFSHLMAETPGSDSGRYAALLIIIGVQLALIMPGAVAESYLEGFQTYYLKNNITIVNSLLGSAVVYIFINPENGLVLLALVNTLGMGVKNLLFIWLLARPRYGGVSYVQGRFSMAVLFETICFGAKSFVQGLSTRIENATDSLVIGVFLGPAMVPLYSIPANLVGYLRTVTYNLTHALMPIFSEMHARDEATRMRELYFTCSRITIALVLPLALGMTVMGSVFIGLWVGPEFAQEADVIVALLVFFTAVPAINPLASRYLTAINEHGIFVKLTPMSAAMNLILSVTLVKPFGIAGVAAGSAIPVALFFPIYLRLCCRHLNVTMAAYVRAALIPSLLPLVAMAISLLCYRKLVLIDSYLLLTVGAVGSVVVYIFAYWCLGLSIDERAWLRARFVATGR